MLIIVSSHNAALYWAELASMHHLRRRVFKERLGWNVSVINGLEIDQFDIPDAHYLLHLAPDGRVNASTRLLPTDGPYLLGDVFPNLVDGPIPRDRRIWESSRFCACPETAPANSAALLMIGMLEFGLQRGITAFVSISDIRMEPIVRRAGWAYSRLGGTLDTGTDTAAGERFEVTATYLARVRQRAGVQGPLLANTETLSDVA